MSSISRFVTDDAGADLIEYALLAGLISLACVATLGEVGKSIGGLFTSLKTKIDGAFTPAP
jgi:pilus assembly protein Flp/PilA